MIDLGKILIDGAIISALASIVLLVTLCINPRLSLQDYPQEIQDAVPPKTPEGKRLATIIGVAFLLVLSVGPLISTLTLKHQAGDATTFRGLWIHAAVVAFCFNLVDLLILDWLIFCAITPRFVVVPGTAGMGAYKDYGFHFRGFLIGTAISVAAGLVLAMIAWFV